MINCPKCNRPNRPVAKFCTGCGAPLSGGYAPLRPGQTMKGSTYRIVRPLTKGGMGAIYLAEDLGAFGRLRVVKEMLDYYDARDPVEVQKAQKLFEDEARTLATLKHSGIPDILAYFAEGGRNYIVMEYVEGEDLEQSVSHEDARGNRVQAKLLPPEQVVRIGIQVCQVLEYLAGQSPPVVHHDIKPANLILDKNSGQVRLVDFGTAKARLMVQPGGTVGLQKSSIYGTAGYAPPEQYQAQSEPRSDVYALAATLYHLLTDDDPQGHPFSFPNQAQLDPSLAGILSRALEPDATRRGNATQLRQALEKWRRSPRKKKTRSLIDNFRVVLPAVPGSAVGATVQALVQVLKVSEQQATIWAYSAPQAVLKTRGRTRASQVTTQLKAAGIVARMVTVDEGRSSFLSTAKKKQLTDKGYAANLSTSRLGRDKRCHCYVCGHEWTSRKTAGGPPPTICPKCKVKEWSHHRLFKCRVCGHEFAHGNQHRGPKQLFPVCPACGATDWLPRQGPVLRLTAQELNLGTVRLGQRRSTVINISNAGKGKLRGVIRCRELWLQVEKSFAMSGKVTIPIDTRRLVGERHYQGVIDVISNGGAAEVQIELFAQTPEKIAVSPTALDFGRVGAQTPLPQTLQVTNTGGGTLQGTVTTDAPWIKVSSTNVSGNALNLSISVNPAEMPGGQALTGSIRLATNGGDVTIPVRANALPTSIAPTLSSLDFGTVPLRETRRLVVRVTNTGVGLLEGRVTSAPDWIRLEKTHWSGNAFDLAVEVEGRSLADGVERSGVIRLASNGGTVDLAVRAVALGPTLAVEPSSLDFGDLPAGWRAKRRLRLTNLGLGRLKGSVRVTAPWLHLKRDRFSGKSANLDISSRTEGLSPGRYVGTIEIDSNGGQVQVGVQVQITDQSKLGLAIKRYWRQAVVGGAVGGTLVMCLALTLATLISPPVQPSPTLVEHTPTIPPTFTPIVIESPTAVTSTSTPIPLVPTQTPFPTAGSTPTHRVTSTTTHRATSTPTRHATSTPTRRPTRTATPVPLCPNPQVRITEPGSGATLRGTVDIQGSANVDRFDYYKFEWRPEGDQTWSFLVRFEQPVSNGVLMTWDTAAVPPGACWLRLVVVDQTGNYPKPCEFRVTVER